MKPLTYSLPILLVAVIFILGVQSSNADKSTEAITPEIKTETHTSHNKSLDFLAKNCFECHDEDIQKGDLQLDNLKWKFDDKKSFAIWEKVYRNLHTGQMPPKKQPDELSKNNFLSKLKSELVHADRKFNESEGRSIVRRLTRVEYENTIKDIFETPYLDLARYLPEDGDNHGFSKDTNSLSISSVHLESYLAAASAVLDSLATPGNKPKFKSVAGEFDTKKFKPQYLPVIKKDNGEAWIFTNGFATHHTRPAALTEKIDAPGYYKIKFKAKAVQSRNPVLLKLFSDASTVLQSEWIHLNFYDVKADQWQEYEEKVWLEKGSSICFTLPECKHVRSGAIIQKQPSVSVKDIEVQGPFIKEWPLKRHSLLWGDLQVKYIRKQKDYVVSVPANPEKKAGELITNFINTVMRRPAEKQEQQLYLEVFNRLYQNGTSFQESLLGAYKGILCSPAFIFKNDFLADFDQYTLASRLSYFLWNSTPDRQLLDLAKNGKLKDPVLSAQVDRMIDDKRFDRFINDFNEQWLNLDEIDATTPDPRLYPEATPVLFEFMKLETNSFVKELIRKNLKLSNLIKSDFSMLNSKLAKHYGVKEVEGIDLRPVNLSSRPERGGLITHGSVMKVTANGTVTSPITRGVWFLENIMGTPPPPPPNTVPAFEPSADDSQTLRDGLAGHRSNEACAGCHKRIDPPGFAFESFDPIGAYRTKYRIYHKKRFKKGRLTENSDTLSDGSKFKNITEFKNLILRDQELLVRNFLNKITIYSTGKALSFSDDLEVERIIENTKANGFKVRDIIHQFILSKIFLKK